MAFLKDLKTLLKPYYWLNLLMSFSYIIAKKVPILCQYTFPNSESKCELDAVSMNVTWKIFILPIPLKYSILCLERVGNSPIHDGSCDDTITKIWQSDYDKLLDG